MNWLHLYLKSSSLYRLNRRPTVAAKRASETEQTMPGKETDNVVPFLKALRLIEPLIAENRATFDRERQLHDAVFEALADAGLFRLWAGRSYRRSNSCASWKPPQRSTARSAGLWAMAAA